MTVIQIGGYNFQRKKNRIIVELKNRDEQELGRVTELFLKEREAYRKKNGGHPLRGKWQLCQNPRCQRAVYLAPWAARRKQNSYFCSLGCQGKARAGILVSRWFRSLGSWEQSSWKQEGWIVDTARLYRQAPRRVKKLEILLDWEPEKIREILLTIIPHFPNAKRIVENFLETEEGKALKIFLNKDPEILNTESGLFSFQSRENFGLTKILYHGKIRAIARNLPRGVFHRWVVVFCFGGW